MVNVSATLPAAVAGAARDGTPVRVHFATRAPELDERWRVVELRSADGARPARGRAGRDGSSCAARSAELELVAPYASGSRLLLARFDGAGARSRTTSQRHGEPIRYGYVERAWPLDGLPERLRDDARAAPRCRAPGGRSPPELITALVGARRGRSRRSRCTPASPRPSATSRRSPSSTRCRRRPRGWSTRPARRAGG